MSHRSIPRAAQPELALYLVTLVWQLYILTFSAFGSRKAIVHCFKDVSSAVERVQTYANDSTDYIPVSSYPQAGSESLDNFKYAQLQNAVPDTAAW